MADANCLLLLVSFLADASFVELLGYLRTLLLTACGNGVRFHAFACSFLFVPILRPLDYHLTVGLNFYLPCPIPVLFHYVFLKASVKASNYWSSAVRHSVLQTCITLGYLMPSLLYDLGNAVGKEMCERGLPLERCSVVLFDLTGIIPGGRCLERAYIAGGGETLALQLHCK